MANLDDWDITSGVGITALGVAAGRAMETRRADSLVADPYAAHFVSHAQVSMPLPTTPDDLHRLPDGDGLRDMWAMMSDYLGVRSRFFDEFLREAVAEGARQVVVLAAGLDVRAQRLSWPPGVTVFEIDRPKVLDFKADVLADEGVTAACDRRTVAVDLREDWTPALLESGYDPAAPAAWLAEGLLPYLPAEAVEGLFRRVHELTVPGSRLAAEEIGEGTRALLDEPAFRAAQERFGIDVAGLWPDDERPDAAGWLRRHGWQVHAAGALQVAASFGRALGGPAAGGLAEGTLLTARRS